MIGVVAAVTGRPTPDQPDPMAGRHAQARLVQEHAPAEPQGDVVQVQHDARGIARAAALPNACAPDANDLQAAT